MKFCAMKKETEMPYVGYAEVLGVENLYISLKIYNKKSFQRPFFSINFWYVVKMGSCVRANSIIYKENFEINAPCPWSFDVGTVECLNVITVLNVIKS